MSGSQCCENPPSLDSSSGVGHVKEFGGLSSYVNCPPGSKSAVLFVSDVFGYEAPKLRKLADKVAAAGFCVVVPDFLRGYPLNLGSEGAKPVNDWLKEHGPDQAVEDAKPVLEALKDCGVTKIGAVGFCWGAKVVVELAKDFYVQVAALIHPSFVTLNDIKAVKVPITILGAEIDRTSPPELVKQFEATLNANPEVECFVKIYPGVSHGWTVRYNDEEETVVKLAEEAHQDMLNWLVKFLK